MGPLKFVSFFIVAISWVSSAAPAWATEYAPWTAPAAELTSAMPFPGDNIEKLSNIPAKSFNCLCDVSPLSRVIPAEQRGAIPPSKPASVTVALSEGVETLQATIQKASPGSSIIVTGTGTLSGGTLTLRPDVHLIFDDRIQLDDLETIMTKTYPIPSDTNTEPGGTVMNAPWISDSIQGVLEFNSIGKQPVPPIAVIAGHMKHIAKLLRDHPQVTPDREGKKAEKETCQVTKELERSVNRTILEAREKSPSSSQRVSRTWRDFQKNILRPAIIEDAKKDGNTSRVLAYARGSILFEKLLRSEITRAP